MEQRLLMVGHAQVIRMTQTWSLAQAYKHAQTCDDLSDRYVRKCLSLIQYGGRCLPSLSMRRPGLQGKHDDKIGSTRK